MKLKIPEYIDVSSSNFIYSVVTGVEGEYLSVSDLAHIKNLSIDNLSINKISSLLPSGDNVSIGSQTESFKNLYVGTVYLVSNNLILGQLSSNKLALFSNENEFSITEDSSSSSAYSVLKRRIQTENVGSIDYSTQYDQNDHQDYDYNSIVFSIATGASTTDPILELNKDYVVCDKPLSIKGNILKGDRTNYIYPEVDGTLNLGYVLGSTQNRFNTIYCNTLDASVNVNSGLVGLERANLQASYASSSSSAEYYGFGSVSSYIREDVIGTPQYEQSLTFKSHHVSGSLVIADYYLLEPSENNKVDLGSSTNKFRNVYANSLVLSDSSSDTDIEINESSFSFNSTSGNVGITLPIGSCVKGIYQIWFATDKDLDLTTQGHNTEIENLLQSCLVYDIGTEPSNFRNWCNKQGVTVVHPDGDLIVPALNTVKKNLFVPYDNDRYTLLSSEGYYHICLVRNYGPPITQTSSVGGSYIQTPYAWNNICVDGYYIPYWNKKYKCFDLFNLTDTNSTFPARVITDYALFYKANYSASVKLYGQAVECYIYRYK